MYSNLNSFPKVINREAGFKFPKFNTPVLDTPDVTPNELVDFHVTHNPSYPSGILAGSEKDGIANDYHTVERNKNEPLVYFTVLLGIMKAGCVPFAISPRNSPAAIAHLLKTSGCQNVYVEFDPRLMSHNDSNMSVSEKMSRDQMDEVLKLLPESHLREVMELPSAHALFPRLVTGSAYIFDSTVHEKLESIPTPLKAACEPVMILHSSGSTAFPKTLYMSRSGIQSWLRAPLSNRFCWEGELTAAMALPAFHAMGFHVGSLINLSTGSISGFFRPEFGPDGRCKPKTPNSFNVIQAIASLGCTVASLSPMMLTEFASEPSSIETLRTLKRVGFGGGPLNTEIGNQLVKGGVNLCVVYGSTEVGPISALFSDRCLGTDWEYFEMSPQLTTRFIPHENDLYELVVLSSDMHRCSTTAIESTLSPQTYHTNDLLAKHPTLPLYRVVGRLDDQIMLSNSEKTNPGPMEAIIAFNPAIKSALMFGRGKPQNGVIIEPEEAFVLDITNRKAVEEYISRIWPSIVEANNFGPSHSRLTRDLIMIIDPRVTPLPRTSKGQLSRPKVTDMFQAEIEAKYSNDQPLDSNSAFLDVSLNPQEIMIGKSVRNCVEHIVSLVLDGDIDPEEDLFSQGCDSLHARHIRTRIVQLIQKSSKNTPHVPQNILYRYPTISMLTEWVLSILSHIPLYLSQSDEDRCARLIKMIKKYQPSI
ncbi:uncharacterized protein MELLADRAFT_107156 [Melampsora larici-populina 98AG31]|uniref:AMP-dependent synthetase/ligase domain-containing protein n=1 Tax=Melampsora larici-populina (strain 98AG31 / pathotype 3-4-7) TaxID=747676 RepID=F4RP13_MELLP|nr:uncharacterized protein MELLADRAFT_107156 [Melampsora larici-populina 98AG31]EGG05935.1 hypothetical protein MELLADRAFT_107156 [Melampsora larici-populina 98AG31]